MKILRGFLGTPPCNQAGPCFCQLPGEGWGNTLPLPTALPCQLVASPKAKTIFWIRREAEAFWAGFPVILELGRVTSTAWTKVCGACWLSLADICISMLTFSTEWKHSRCCGRWDCRRSRGAWGCSYPEDVFASETHLKTKSVAGLWEKLMWHGMTFVKLGCNRAT